jgi:hypothetical protein
MNTIVVYLLVGCVHWSSGGTTAPAYPAFPDKASCESVRTALMDIALSSKLRCVETKIVK